jgi:hypothetical protein
MSKHRRLTFPHLKLFVMSGAAVLVAVILMKSLSQRETRDARKSPPSIAAEFHPCVISFDLANKNTL